VTGNNGGDDQLEQSDPSDTPNLPTRPPRQPTTERLIDQFARTEGFSPNGDALFTKSSGETLQMQRGSTFPWLLSSPDGAVISRILVREQTFGEGPLELEAEAWTLIQQAPNEHALLVRDGQRNPKLVSGESLRELESSGKLKIYPATYRLVLDL
jgi:hypothetical protein